MRTIEDHKVNPANDTLSITVVDEPGHGGACHAYLVTGCEWDRNPASGQLRQHCRDHRTEGLGIQFQNGPIAEVGVNGLTHEVLLAILADRLRGFQAGPYACPENAQALQHINAAQAVLQARTRARMERGVEGTHRL